MAFNNEDILVLAKAGFTAQQIAALSQVAPAAPTVDTTVPTAPAGSVAPIAAPAPTAQAPQPSAPAATATAPAATPAPATAAPHSVDDVLAAISGLSQSIQNQNLLNAQMPAQQKTAEMVLASIINPPTKKEE